MTDDPAEERAERADVSEHHPSPEPLRYLVREPSGGTPSPRIVVILHGHGDDPAPLVDRAGALARDDVVLVAPVGPVRTADGGPAWFASVDGDVPGRPGEAGSLAEAIHRLSATVDQVRTTRDEPVERIAGYSQGAATALALGFGASDDPGRWRPGTVATLAGWLPSDPDVMWDFAGAAGHTRAVLIHGADDEVVDAQMGRSAARVLERSGVEVTFTEVSAGHALTDDGILRLLG